MPPPIVHSALKVLLVDGASGLIGGLALGLGLLAVMAIASDRIRQRDEVADALGAPVELSVGRFGRFRVMRTSTSPSEAQQAGTAGRADVPPAAGPTSTRVPHRRGSL